MTVSVSDIAWLAGFLEGEGAFVLTSKVQPMITVSQKDREPLDKLVSMVGGKVKKKCSQGYKKGWIYNVEIASRRAAGIMMTIFSFMSKRRQVKIMEILDAWKKHPTKNLPYKFREAQ